MPDTPFPCVSRAGMVTAVRSSYVFTGDFFRKNITFLKKKNVEATELVKSYDNRTAVTTAARMPFDNGLTGSLRALEIHRRPNVNEA